MLTQLALKLRLDEVMKRGGIGGGEEEEEECNLVCLYSSLDVIIFVLQSFYFRG